ncbi:MAG TPA: hypothetical protein VGG27_17670 [Magnetospirillaceae bacterium]
MGEGPEGDRLRNLPALAIVLLVVVIAGYLITKPTDEVALDSGCDPEDMQAQLSAWLYGDEFWQKQQVAMTNEIETLQDLRNEANTNPGRPVNMTPIEIRMRRLSEKAKAAAAAADDRLWREQILTLGRCEGVASRRLAQ